MTRLSADLLAGFAWLDHGFGSRHCGPWTDGPGRSWATQIHSAAVLSVTQAGHQGEADALITNQPGLWLEIRTADCLPILLADPDHRAVAAIHAGWRGTEAGIVAQTVAHMAREFHSRPGSLVAAIGPGIGPCCFEVGPEVAERFGRSGRVNLNLAEENRRQLTDCGVEQIWTAEECTRCRAEMFHSYRRDGEKAGRLRSAIRISA